MELPFLLLVALFTAAAQGQYQTTGTPSDQNTQPYTDYDYFKAAAPAINYRLCSTNSPFTIKRLDVSPTPLRFGAAATVTVQGNSTEEVTGGKVQVSVVGKGRLSFIKYQKDYEICSTFPSGCPIKKGPLSFSFSREIPALPSKFAGSYVIDMKAMNTQSRELICVEVDVEIAA